MWQEELQGPGKRADSKNKSILPLSTSPTQTVSLPGPARPTGVLPPAPPPSSSPSGAPRRPSKPRLLLSDPRYSRGDSLVSTFTSTDCRPGRCSKGEQSSVRPNGVAVCKQPFENLRRGRRGRTRKQPFQALKINLQLSKTNLEHGAGNALRSLSATRSSPSRSSNPRATRLRTLPSPQRQAPAPEHTRSARCPQSTIRRPPSPHCVSFALAAPGPAQKRPSHSTISRISPSTTRLQEHSPPIGAPRAS